MITAVMTRQGKRIHVLSEHDLDLTLSGSGSGERLRAFCPVHGSDHQRSLSIDAASGWGFCHCCHSTVLVEEYAPDAAETLRRSEHPVDHTRGPPLPVGIRHPLPEHPTRPRLPVARPQWQCDEVAALEAAWPLMQEELASWRASAYLDERAIPLEIAASSEIGYLSCSAWEDTPVPREQRDVLTRWIGRFVFPLGSPDGRGFIGRTIVRWEPGMDENEHKTILEAANIKRWIKTNPAGWYGSHPSHYAPTLALVEGGFDRLALIAAGVSPHTVVALVGTVARADWIVRFAPQVKRVVLGLDGDESGHEAMERLAGGFRQACLAVDLCPPPHDGNGKDWSERYRECGPAGVWPLCEALAMDRHNVTEIKGGLNKHKYSKGPSLSNRDGSCCVAMSNIQKEG